MACNWQVEKCCTNGWYVLAVNNLSGIAINGQICVFTFDSEVDEKKCDIVVWKQQLKGDKMPLIYVIVLPRAFCHTICFFSFSFLSSLRHSSGNGTFETCLERFIEQFDVTENSGAITQLRLCHCLCVWFLCVFVCVEIRCLCWFFFGTLPDYPSGLLISVRQVHINVEIYSKRVEARVRVSVYDAVILIVEHEFYELNWAHFTAARFFFSSLHHPNFSHFLKL